MDGIDSGDRSFRARRVESVAQASVALQRSGVELDPRLAEISRAAAGEGIVLLENDGILPVDSGAMIAVFGRCQIDYFSVGYGSGGDVKAPYVWNLVDALRDAGAVLDERVANYYSEWCEAHPPAQGEWGTWPFSFEEAPLDRALSEQSAVRARTAVVVLGRAAGEARDNELVEGSYYLTADEIDMLDGVCSAFDRVVVVIDTGGHVDLAWLDRYQGVVSAVLLAWHGGMEGARALADIIVGKNGPSGRLTSTIAREYTDYPSSRSFGDEHANAYTEDVFVGYRYFETVAPDRVRYPFGFGLGYTTFSLETHVEASSEHRIRFRSRVTNTGERAGREVVQVYMSPPAGALPKPSRCLVAFAKSSELAPGETQVLDFELSAADFASFDDSGLTGHHSSWVLEAGSYRIFVGRNVREARLEHEFAISETCVTEQLAAILPVPEQLSFDRMTIQTDAGGETLVAWEPVPSLQADRKTRIEANVQRCSFVRTSEGAATLRDVAAGRLSVEEFVAQLGLEDVVALLRGGLVMNSPLGAPGNAGVLGGVTEGLRDRGIPVLTATDGPSGIRVASYASLLPSGTALASTWNTGVVEELSALMAEEMAVLGSDVLLGPGMNIQRDPLCGRNFEYFSEDPLVTGRIAASVVKGIQSTGGAACPKHFAANNQESNRTLHDSRVSERALREIYLRGFRICLDEAAPRALMTAYNKINGVWAYYNDALVTTVLRDEWGFDGMVMTDWWTEPAEDPDWPRVRDSAYRIRAQVDLLMPGAAKTEDTPTEVPDDAVVMNSVTNPDGLSMGELHRSAVNVLRFVLRSRAFQEAAS